jgi:hypothetical protein
MRERLLPGQGVGSRRERRNGRGRRRSVQVTASHPRLRRSRGECVEPSAIATTPRVVIAHDEGGTWPRRPLGEGRCRQTPRLPTTARRRRAALRRWTRHTGLARDERLAAHDDDPHVGNVGEDCAVARDRIEAGARRCRHRQRQAVVAERSTTSATASRHCATGAAPVRP